MTMLRLGDYRGNGSVMDAPVRNTSRLGCCGMGEVGQGAPENSEDVKPFSKTPTIAYVLLGVTALVLLAPTIFGGKKKGKKSFYEASKRRRR